jgi:hypothetical protein
VARKFEVCSPLSGVEAQVRECINSQARMEGAGAENERDQRGNQPNENVQPLRRSILYTAKTSIPIKILEIQMTNSRSILSDLICSMAND